jgi:anti-anti-sigma factor
VTHTVTVRIVGLPVEIHLQASEHHATLTRELALIGASDDPAAVPARVRDLADQMRAQYAGIGEEPQALMAAAAEAKVPTVDLVYELPADIVDGVKALDALLDELDAYCAAGQLLTLVTPPELANYRRWFLGEFIEQITTGRPPQPWRELPAGEVNEPNEQPGGAAASGVVRITGDLDFAGAALVRTELARRIDGGDATLEVDMAECGFIDSVGVSLLLTTRARCLERGGQLRITAVQRAVERTLVYAGVFDLLTEPDRPEAPS